MTLEEAQTAQRHWSTRKWASRFGSAKASSAAGAPQFMRATLEELIDQLGLRGSQTFDRDVQDRLAYHLLIRCGYHQFVNGEIDRTEFGRRLSMEWASFPVLEATKGANRHIPRCVSYYEGDSLNKALLAPEKVEALLGRVYTIANSAVVHSSARACRQVETFLDMASDRHRHATGRIRGARLARAAGAGGRHHRPGIYAIASMPAVRKKLGLA